MPMKSMPTPLPSLSLAIGRTGRVALVMWMGLVGAVACAPFMGSGSTASPEATAPGVLAAEIDAILAVPEFEDAHWGVVIRSLESGEVVYTRNADRLFVPASNMKLVTGAAALETLGEEYRYRTTLSAGGPISDGAIEGPLVVTGTGDPTFSTRFLADSRDAFRAWADSLRARGVTRVAGAVIGVDTAFVDPPLGTGWMWDDLTTSSSAEFGALQFNEGIVDVDLFPSQTTLEPAVIVLTPPTQYVRVMNDTRTLPLGSVTTLSIEREEAGPGIIVRGEIASGDTGESRSVAVRDPGLYLASVVRETLRESGIAVEGPAIHYSAIGIDDQQLVTATEIFSYFSPPLSEILPGMMKPSQNQIAETLLRTVGREIGGEGSASGGVAVIDSLFSAWNLDQQTFRMADGSGLSRYDLLSPELLVELLTHMDASPYRDLWLESLPVAGRDGTLEDRMRDPPLVDRVLAKTGSLSGVRALSGYLTAPSGERFVFSIIANNYLAPSSSVDRVVESILQMVATIR
ncbi:MAG: D-alanyl-D-alanine carboxypeptidase/D-alanyl-D-alanine-endopeptidase [Gemmatimonas sp.]|nr:D-alanyl-D-alanine carboxypeptidase/D-alanyl-D-alanine-endopeptidase [Gemmatimonas sp.]